MAQLDTPNLTRGRDTITGNDSSVQQKAEDTFETVKAQGAEAKAAFTDVADSFGDAIDSSLKSRPYATLAMAAGMGFLLGALWRS